LLVENFIELTLALWRICAVVARELAREPVGGFGFSLGGGKGGIDSEKLDGSGIYQMKAVYHFSKCCEFLVEVAWQGNVCQCKAGNEGWRMCTSPRETHELALKSVSVAFSAYMDQEIILVQFLWLLGLDEF